MSGRWMDTRQAAAFLGMAPGTLVNARSSGRLRIPFVKIGARRVVYDRADLEKYIADRKVIPGGGAEAAAS